MNRTRRSQRPVHQTDLYFDFVLPLDQSRLALEVSTDPDHQFDLAVSLDDFDTALSLVRSGPKVGSEPRWRTLGDKALARWNIPLAEECFEKAGDLSALLLLATSKGDRDLLARLASQASEKGLTNIAFAAYLQLGNTTGCISLLLSAERFSEAALFARTYAPSQAGGIVKQWKTSLAANKRAKQRAIAKSLADPTTDPDMFEEGWGEALSLEREVSVAAEGNLSNGSAGAEDDVGKKVVPDEAVKVNGAAAEA